MFLTCHIHIVQVRDKTQNSSLLSTSATLAGLYRGGGGYCASPCLPTSLKLESSTRQSRTVNYWKYGHTYHLNNRTSIKTMDARVCTALHRKKNRIRRVFPNLVTYMYAPNIKVNSYTAFSCSKKQCF